MHYLFYFSQCYSSRLKDLYLIPLDQYNLQLFHNLSLVKYRKLYLAQPRQASYFCTSEIETFMISIRELAKENYQDNHKSLHVSQYLQVTLYMGNTKSSHVH